MQNLEKYQVNFFQGKINNNLPYFLFQRSGQPIHINASFVSGARFDTKPGIAHFLEHMLLAGSQKYPNKRLLTTPLENIGGSIGGSTGIDLLTLSLEVAESKDLDFALSILDEAINYPLFDSQTIETERGAILAEIQMRFHNRATRVWDLSNTLVYQKTPYARIVCGDEASVKSITQDDLIDFYKNIFKKNPISWSISGYIDEKKVVDSLKKFHKSEILIDNIFKETLPVVREENTYLEIFEDNKADIYFGFRTESAKVADMASLEIISSYLASGRGCKLQEELRYKKGLIYGCRGENFLSFDGGDWSITTACLAENAQEVLDIIVRELGKIKETGISDDELSIVKNKIIKNNIIKMQTSRSWANSASRAAFIAVPEKFLINDYEEAIRDVTPEFIIAVARKYFTLDNWYLVMCGPQALKNIKVNLN